MMRATQDNNVALRPLRLRDACRACLARPAHQCDAAREVQVLVLQHVVDNGSLTGIDDAGKNKSLLTPSSSSCLILCAALRCHSHEHLSLSSMLVNVYCIQHKHLVWLLLQCTALFETPL